mgnify:CR=1 FL=1
MKKVPKPTRKIQKLDIIIKMPKTLSYLEDEIKKQAEENPIIEVEMQNSERKVDWERYINHLKHHTYNDKNESRYNMGSEMDFENIISNNQNLYDYLKEQINCYKIDKTEKRVCCLIAILISGLVLAAMLVAYTYIGSDIILGVQGRYFIPILPLMLYAMDSDFIVLKRNIDVEIIFAVHGLQLYAIWAITSTIVSR